MSMSIPRNVRIDPNGTACTARTAPSYNSGRNRKIPYDAKVMYDVKVKEGVKSNQIKSIHDAAHALLQILPLQLQLQIQSSILHHQTLFHPISSHPPQAPSKAPVKPRSPSASSISNTTERYTTAHHHSPSHSVNNLDLRHVPSVLVTGLFLNYQGQAR